MHPSIRYSLPCIRGLTEHIMGCTPLRLAGLDKYFKILASFLSQRHLIRLISTYLNCYYMGNVRLGQMDNSSNIFGLHPTMSHIMLTPLLSAKCRMHCLIMVSTVCKKFSHFPLGISKSHSRMYLKLKLDSSNI